MEKPETTSVRGVLHGVGKTKGRTLCMSAYQDKMALTGPQSDLEDIVRDLFVITAV